MRYTGNLQPVIPISFGDNWNLITRTIIPLIYAESPVAGSPGNCVLLTLTPPLCYVTIHSSVSLPIESGHAALISAILLSSIVLYCPDAIWYFVR
jgi:hypothetical protein